MKSDFFLIEEITLRLFSRKATQRHQRGHRGQRGKNATLFLRKVTEAALFFLLMSITSSKHPKTVRETHVFIRFVNFYQRFIEGFSRIARPLFKKLSKDTKF